MVIKLTRQTKFPSLNVNNAPIRRQHQWNKMTSKQKSFTKIINRDSDGDGVPNGFDCRPFDPTRQDSKILKAMGKGLKATGRGIAKGTKYASKAIKSGARELPGAIDTATKYGARINKGTQAMEQKVGQYFGVNRPAQKVFKRHVKLNGRIYAEMEDGTLILVNLSRANSPMRV